MSDQETNNNDDRSGEAAELLLPRIPMPNFELRAMLSVPILPIDNDELTVVVVGQSQSASTRINTSRQTSREDGQQQQTARNKLIAGLDWLKVRNETVLFIHLALTLILLILKILVAYLSGSMSIRSLVGDSAVDLINLGLLLGASYLSARSSHAYPFGRANMETLANFTMALFMTCLLVLVMYQSALRLGEKAQYFWFNGADPQKANITSPDFVIVIALCVIKLILLAICIVNPSAQTKILKKDHLVDIPMNVSALFLGYIGSFGTRNQWTEKFIMIDDIGAICLAIYGTYIWLPQILKHTKRACHHIVEDPEISDKIRNAAANKLASIVYPNENVSLGDPVICHGGGDKIIIMQIVVLPDEMAHERVKQIFTHLKNELNKIDNVARVIVHWEA